MATPRVTLILGRYLLRTIDRESLARVSLPDNRAKSGQLIAALVLVATSATMGLSVEAGIREDYLLCRTFRRMTS
jgi:hypothetical protein